MRINRLAPKSGPLSAVLCSLSILSLGACGSSVVGQNNSGDGDAGSGGQKSIHSSTGGQNGVAWMRYFIYSDAGAESYFFGESCVLCMSPWENPQRKNWGSP
jgi:hypothetical protein